MSQDKTVVYGEAPESDSEENSIDQDETQDHRISNSGAMSDNKHQTSGTRLRGYTNADNNGTGSFADIGSSLFASISSAASLAKLANYSSYNLLTSSGPFAPVAPKKETKAEQTDSELANLPLLHRKLYLKNQQLAACVTHLKRHPFEKAAKDFHTISQRLVASQKVIQDANNALVKLKREYKNLDFDLRLIS